MPISKQRGMRQQVPRHALAAAVFSFIMLLPAAALADTGTSMQDWPAVDPTILEQMRGGFDNTAGLDVSFGIDRVVRIDGSVVLQSSWHIADVRQLSAEQAGQIGNALSSLNSVQNGMDNLSVATPANAGLGATVIQNSLNGQQIDSRTEINASVNTLGTLTSLNFLGSLSDAIAHAAMSH